MCGAECNCWVCRCVVRSTDSDEWTCVVHNTTAQWAAMCDAQYSWWVDVWCAVQLISYWTSVAQSTTRVSGHVWCKVELLSGWILVRNTAGEWVEMCRVQRLSEWMCSSEYNCWTNGHLWCIVQLLSGHLWCRIQLLSEWTAVVQNTTAEWLDMSTAASGRGV